MKIIFFKLSLVFVFVVFSLLILIIFSPQDNLSFYSAMKDKIQRLENTSSPRIILVGGSNFSFGVDSKRIENQFNYCVVNMSLNAGLGLEFMLNQLMGNVNKGDIIIISPEYTHFSKHFNGNGEAIYRFLMNNKDQYRYFSSSVLINHFRALAPSIFHQYLKVLTKSVNSVYRRDNFDDHGDMVGHLGLANETFSHGGKKDVNGLNGDDIDNNQINLIDRFITRMTQIGARVYISFPSISTTGYDANEKFNDAVVAVIKSKFYENVLSESSNYIFNDDYFFNSVYHLNSSGRKIRTDRLINDLNSVISN